MRPVILEKRNGLWIPHISVAKFAFNLQLFAANTRYINFNTGNNQTGDGSVSSPWKECPGTQNPIGSNTSGWTTIPVDCEILFESGQTWQRPIYISSTWFNSPTQESERIILKNSSANRAIIDVNGYTTNDYIIDIRQPYITINNFELKNLLNNSNPHGIYAYGVSYLRILNN